MEKQKEKWVNNARVYSAGSAHPSKWRHHHGQQPQRPVVHPPYPGAAGRDRRRGAGQCYATMCNQARQEETGNGGQVSVTLQCVGLDGVGVPCLWVLAWVCIYAWDVRCSEFCSVVDGGWVIQVLAAVPVVVLMAVPLQGGA